MVECKRCGQCCFHIINGKLTGYKCYYLVKDLYDRYTCIIYNSLDRIGILIGIVDNEKFYCHERKDTPYDYLECPYNTNKKIVKI